MKHTDAQRVITPMINSLNKIHAKKNKIIKSGFERREGDDTFSELSALQAQSEPMNFLNTDFTYEHDNCFGH
jgi:hypothetical protein